MSGDGSGKSGSMVDTSTEAVPAAVLQATDNQSRTVELLTAERKGLLVLLRHGGCPFCRQTLAELAVHRGELEQRGILPILVHLMNDSAAKTLFARYDLDDLPRISDPEGRLFDALALPSAGMAAFAGPKVWWPGFKAVILSGRLPGVPAGDVRRLPGTFLIRDGRMLLAQRAATSADPVDWKAFVAATDPQDE